MIVVVVPAYNEEKKIGRVVRGLFEHGYEKVVVVDDGSSDETGKLAAEAGALVVCHALNRGQGAALRTGNQFALRIGAEIIVHFDADGQFNPSDIAGAVRLMREKSLDAVLGSRFLDERSRIPWLKKYLILPFARIVNRLITGIWLTDAHNGFRVLSRAAAEKLVIHQDGMAHNSEIVSKIGKNKMKFQEIPVEVVYHEYGQGIRGGLKVLTDIFISKLFK
ncbi:MAG: glycosyltransferase family 2 protein [Candidatus Magasanikbacteria bacterium]|nr:glycosyltransferase family 2 protein [Candidatus Magasanikbacteria bacterium]